MKAFKGVRRLLRSRDDNRLLRRDRESPLKGPCQSARIYTPRSRRFYHGVQVLGKLTGLASLSNMDVVPAIGPEIPECSAAS